VAFAGADEQPVPIPSRAAQLRPVTAKAATRTRTSVLSAARRLAPAARRARTTLMLAGGAACFTAAAFTVATWAGLVVAGAGLLFLEYSAQPSRT
jgi:hypothetical protein